MKSHTMRRRGGLLFINLFCLSPKGCKLMKIIRRGGLPLVPIAIGKEAKDEIFFTSFSL